MNFWDEVLGTVLSYGDRVPNIRGFLERLETFRDPESVLGMLLSIIKASSLQLYVLIDEDDHFANRLWAAGDENAYNTIVKDTGFVRSFYATLKTGTGSGTIARLLMTGVTPLMLDDMSSGFNITSNISMSPRFDTFAGFTRTDVERAIDEFIVALPHLQDELADRSKLSSRHCEGHDVAADARGQTRTALWDDGARWNNRRLFRSWPKDVPERRVEVLGKAAKMTTGKKGRHKGASRR